MRKTRKMIVDAINKQNHNFPICHLRRIGDTLFIDLKDGQYKEHNFKAIFPHDPACVTYYENWKFLSDHPEIEIVELIEDKTKQLSVNSVRKEYI